MKFEGKNKRKTQKKKIKIKRAQKEGKKKVKLHKLSQDFYMY